MRFLAGYAAFVILVLTLFSGVALVSYGLGAFIGRLLVASGAVQ